MFRRLWRIAAPVVAIALTGSVSIALADTIQITESQAGNTFTYAANETAAAKNTVEVQPGDFFTIYDFQGYISGSASAVPNWDFTTAFVGPDAIGVSPLIPDSPTIVNLTWTYKTGSPTIVVAGGLATSSNAFLGNFSAKSTLYGSTDVAYTSQDHHLVSGTFKAAGNTDLTSGPAAVPLPATANMGLALLGCLGGLGAIRRMKLKKECELA